MTDGKSGVLTIVDTTRIQSYIYRSNRLAENLGASHLVYLATHKWVEEVREDNGGTAISSAGGNAIMTFPDRKQAKAFARALSRRVIESAPGLQVRVAHVDYDKSAFLGDVIAEGNRALKTQGVPRSEPMLGLGVTVMCQSTALPATGTAGVAGDTYPAATEIRAKRADVYRDSAEDNLRCVTNLRDLENTYLEHIAPNAKGFQFPRDFDKIGRTEGDNSTLAVIHADGNGIGQLMRKIASRFRKKIKGGMAVEQANKKYREDINKFSNELTKITEEAVNDTVNAVIKWLDREPTGDAERRVWQQMRGNIEKGRLILPLRPLIVGGDDVTLVCDGRLGVAVARIYLECFARHAAEVNFTELIGEATEITACAGVAIVKVHYPFARAYELADELCGNAKKRYRNEGKTGSYLDWHFAVSGMVSTDLDDIRKRLYQDGNLTLRPVVIKQEHLRSWDVVAAGLDAFHADSWARSKRKALQEALIAGQDATQRWLTVYGDVNLPIKTAENGFQEGRCVYYDALELADSYIELEANP